MENRRTFCQHMILALPAVESLLTTRTWAAATPMKPIAIGAETLPYWEVSLDRALEGIRRAGYKHATVSFKHEKKKLLQGSMTHHARNQLKTLFVDSGLTIRMGLIGWDLDVKSDKGQDEYRRQLDVFAELGIPLGLTGGPNRFLKFPYLRKPTPEWKKECDLFLKGLEPVVQHAHSLGIMLVMKPHTGLTATAWDCIELMERLRWPALKIAWDDGNVSFYEGLRPDTDLPYLAPHVRAWCIKDHRGGRANPEFPVPGEGEINLRATLQILLEEGFDGPACVELVAEKRTTEEIDLRLAKAHENLTGILESL